MGTLLRIGFTVLALPTILIIVVNLTDTILTDGVMDALQVVMGYVDQVLGTRVVDILLIAVSSILLIRITRRLFKFITGNLGSEAD